ncbi:MAG: ABC transporter substrate-binding protein [Sedimentisphaerales bacterium]|jgi:ABC-type transport system substrate-binding protein
MANILSQKDFASRFFYAALAAAIVFIIGCGKRPSQSPSQNVLQHRLQDKVKTFNPADIGDNISEAVADEIFEMLYGYHYLKRPYQIVPVLAADMPAVSDDGLTYTIKIKKGVFFADDRCFKNGKGRELNAGDFVFAWKRLADIKMLSSNWWVFEDRIVGLDEFREYTKSCAKPEDVNYSRPVEGLNAADDDTLVIKLKRPWPQILYLLAYISTAPIAKEAVDCYGKDIDSHPVGTGAFKLKAWDRGSYIEMVKNPTYRGEPYPSEGEPGDREAGLLADAGKTMPFVDRIVWRIVPEDQPRWLLFEKGDIDITSIPKDNYGQAIAPGRELTPEMKERNIKLTTIREAATFYIGFNMEDPVLGKNKPLRLVISCAFDREKWIELFFNGRGDVAFGFIPPCMTGYDPNIRQISKTEYNPEKARRLIAEAEKFNGGPLPEFKLTMQGTDTTFRQMGQFLKRSLEEIGLKVEAEYLDWPTYLEKLRTKGLQIYQCGWIADYPDVESFLQIFYSRRAPWPNETCYSNREYDSIFEQAALMNDSPRRTELYREAERIVVEDAPCAFLFHRIFYVMHHDWVSNLKPNAYRPDCFGYGFSKYYRIDVAKRAEYQKKYR